MITTLFFLALVGAGLWGLFWLIGKLVQGTPLTIIGLVMALLFLVYALKKLGLLAGF